MRNAKILSAAAFLLSLGSSVALDPSSAWAAGEPVAQIKTVTGEAFVVRNGSQLPAKAGDQVREGDELLTGADGGLGLTFIDNTVFSAGPNSRISVDEFSFDSGNFRGSMTSSVKKGTLAVVSGDVARSSPDAMKIRTPTAIMGVRGTTFAVQVIEPVERK